MGSPAEKEYKEFEEKVKRTVYIDNLSPLVTEVVIKTALGQFGNVLNVQFLPNHTELKNLPQCALVEMDNEQQAEVVFSELSNPFMMSGMPRPVRAFPAKEEMFADRPMKPGRKIQCRWLEPKDADLEVAKRIKETTRRHRAEASYLLELQLDQERKLSEQQAESLKANYNKNTCIMGLEAKVEWDIMNKFLWSQTCNDIHLQEMKALTTPFIPSRDEEEKFRLKYSNFEVNVQV